MKPLSHATSHGQELLGRVLLSNEHSTSVDGLAAVRIVCIVVSLVVLFIPRVYFVHRVSSVCETGWGRTLCGGRNRPESHVPYLIVHEAG